MFSMFSMTSGISSYNNKIDIDGTGIIVSHCIHDTLLFIRADLGVQNHINHLHISHLLEDVFATTAINIDYTETTYGIELQWKQFHPCVQAIPTTSGVRVVYVGRKCNDQLNGFAFTFVQCCIVI